MKMIIGNVYKLYLKLLISQSRFPGTRKFVLRWQEFWMTFDFEISGVECTCM